MKIFDFGLCTELPFGEECGFEYVHKMAGGIGTYGYVYDIVVIFLPNHFSFMFPPFFRYVTHPFFLLYTTHVRYMSPEVAEKRPYNQGADVFSFGMVLFEILSLTRPTLGPEKNSTLTRPAYLCVHAGQNPYDKF